jgi:hypothetical protein
MANVTIGRLLCEKCGNDCTNLYGSKLEIRGSVIGNSANMQKEIMLVDARYGKHNFYLCWGCAAELMGAKRIDVKDVEKDTEIEGQ